MAYKLADLSSLYDSADRRADELLSGLSEEQANWQPQPGHSWSILQCFDHLVRTNKAFSDRFEPALEKAAPIAADDRDIAVGWLARKLLESTEPPPKKKFKSPKPTVPPPFQQASCCRISTAPTTGFAPWRRRPSVATPTGRSSRTRSSRSCA
jgi:hypothetical protein